ncbi:MAG: UDP-N-acetylglucosamine 1-carboxyvinyltransferase [Gemmatimonadetes bacterium]|nr:UDP-N-acetylglucosamine 1-carboxyvinyltransferase [Gemmatimonadota bacterium]
MDAIVVRGAGPLQGEVPISGSKNAALPILTAAILFDGPLEITNVPELRDITTLVNLLETLGVKAERGEARVVLDAAEITSVEAPYDLVRKMRASIYVLGPLLARCGEARVSLPGGCAWGPRPVDLHVHAMECLGATIDVDHGYLVARAPKGGLKGATIRFPISSVGATCNALFACVTADGTSVLENAAAEPEVVALADFLVDCGARITGQGTTTMTIEGVDRLTPAPHRILPDRIEAGTYLVAAAITGGDLTLTHCRPDHLDSVIEVMRTSGSTIETTADTIRCRGEIPPRGMHVITAPYPGFPTDMQAQMMALASIGIGVSVVTDNIYHDRFTHVPELNRLGADIRLDGNTAVIHPAGGLSGASVMATDLRASAALILAGLVAEGETTVTRVYHIDRGYEAIVRKLRTVGADVERIRVDGP